MSVISRYRRTEDLVAASLGDERAAAALVRAGISTHKLTPLSMSAGGSRGAKNPSTALVGSNRYGANGVDVGLHQDQFKHFSGHPYAIVRTIANRIAGQPIHHARKLRPGQSPQKSAKMAARLVNKDMAPAWVKSMPHDLQEFAESPIVEMFANPNPVMVQHTLAFNTVASLEITAKAFWWLRHEDGDDDGDGIGGEPQGWYLPPQWMEPIHTAEKLFAAWRVRPNNGGEPFILSAEEVVYYYYSDPANPLEAYSPFEALAQPIMASESISESKRRNFLNSMAPSFAVVVGQSAEATGVGAALPQPVLTRSQRKALKSVLLEEYRGTLASGLPFVLDGFVRDIKPIYQTPRELDFLNSSQVTMQELNMGFGVNGISMGQVQDANRASSATADDHLCLNVINPRLSLMSQVATRCLPRFFSNRNDEVVYWEPAKSHDVEFEHKQRMDAYGCGVINRDEWRSALGMGPVSDGTKVLVSGAGISWVDVVPVDGAAAAGKASGPKPPARPGGFKLITGSLAAHLGAKAVAASHDKIHRLYECRIRDAAADVLRGLSGEFRQRVAGLCVAGGATFTPMHVTAALERHHWERTLGDVLTPLLLEAGLAAAAHEWMLAQNRAMATKAFLPPGLRRAVEKAIAAMIGGGVWRRLVDVILFRARAAVEHATKTNQNPAAAAVDAVASEEAIADRAAEIGLEEAQNAVGVGQKETYATLKMYNKAGGRQWYTMKDSRVRDTHQRAHGQIVRGDQKFVVGGHPCDYPGDRSLPPEERCGCRCVVLTVE